MHHREQYCTYCGFQPGTPFTSVERRRSSEASTPSLQELCKFTIDFIIVEEEEKGRKLEQEVEKEDQSEETAHTWMAMEMT